MDSHNKVAVVTGAGTGIGRAVTLALLRDGVHIVIRHPHESIESGDIPPDIRGEEETAVEEGCASAPEYLACLAGHDGITPF